MFFLSDRKRTVYDKKKKEIYMYILQFIVTNFVHVSIVFQLKQWYMYGTDIFTMQQKSDNDGILNFDVKAAQETYIKLEEISKKTKCKTT